jgi:integrase
MKGELGAQFEHWVPLSAQAVTTIEAVPRTGVLLFPNRRSPRVPMTGDALSALLARAGYRGRHVPHGWRASFSTMMNQIVERQGRIEDRAIIDLMLAHMPHGGVEHLYNWYAYMDRRREIAQAWADLLLPTTD